uniref:Uncharacterized protein n=1 Tax=Cyclophora tenuis TaxID=216820 RepID=A0A7S1D3X2_CYCTE|mmetsp:Transcript_18176/g.30982  ORF Transcript_18176/g.30982 Transcript_18176/m.30982 type:complete len:130 (+) Transcript_18176:240-629(+)
MDRCTFSEYAQNDVACPPTTPQPTQQPTVPPTPQPTISSAAASPRLVPASSSEPSLMTEPPPTTITCQDDVEGTFVVAFSDHSCLWLSNTSAFAQFWVCAFNRGARDLCRATCGCTSERDDPTNSVLWD